MAKCADFTWYLSLHDALLYRLLQQQVCRAGYKVIEEFLNGDSRKNELYLSCFIPYFEAQVSMLKVLLFQLEIADILLINGCSS